jgi:dTDP-4-amino-4,6-dideoxy-D-glucose acyltransferase
MSNYYSDDELELIGFKKIGKNCKISKLSSYYNVENISIGNNVRIDDFCVISAGTEGIHIGNYVHISCHVSICGKSKITISDFSCVSFKSTIISSCDDFSGDYMANPTIPEKYTNVSHKPVFIDKHVIIGAYTFIMPNVNICENVSIGAYSFVKKSILNKGVYCGNPLRFLRDKRNNCVFLSKNI